MGQYKMSKCVGILDVQRTAIDNQEIEGKQSAKNWTGKYNIF